MLIRATAFPLRTLGLLAALAVGPASPLFAQAPDLTADGVVATIDRKLTYNLGATGMRGWIHTKAEAPGDNIYGRTTGTSRQILVTHVGKDSPAHGVMQVDDVILGIDDQPFAADARKSIAWAIQESEKSPVGGEEEKPGKTRSGSLVLLRWRAGKTELVELKMRVLGTYSDTAPYNCPKSAKILEEACAALQKETNTWKEVNALAMLATGDPRFMPQIEAIAREVGPPTLEYNMPTIGMGVWRMGYLGIFLSEYYLATGDKAVEHALNEVCVTLAKGQSMYGTFGHGISALRQDGKFHGSIPPYGPVLENAASANLAIVLAQRCGLKDSEIDAAVERANGFFGYYVDKGHLGYGEHEPACGPGHGHANNGKGPIVTVMFGVQGDRIRETQYWSKMSVASYPNTEYGHGGQGFSYFWRLMGANMGGPEAAAAFFKELSWHFDLARRCDGSFTYDGGEQFSPGRTEDNTYYGRSTYNGLSPTAYHILSYAVALKKLCITGKEMNPVKAGDEAKSPAWLTRQEVADAIAAGRFEQDQKNLSVEELTKALGNWSHAVRCSAAWELVARPDTRSLVPQLITAAEGPDAWLRMGACVALGQFKAPEALPVLIRLLRHEDRSLRWLAARALENFDADIAAPHVEALLQALIANARPNDPIDWSDPLQFANQALSRFLFNGKLTAATAKVRKDLLLPALRVAMQLPTGFGRGQACDFVRTQLSKEDAQMLTPDLVEWARTASPADQMFSFGARVVGVEMLAKHRMNEAIPVAVELQNVRCWGDGNLHGAGLSALKQYGGAARWTLPALREAENFSADLGNVIEAIATATTAPDLISGLPVATPQVVATKEAKLITLTGTTPFEGLLTYAIVDEPAHGTLSGTPPSVTYTPADGYQGTDRFTFKVSSETITGKLESPPGTVSLIVGAAGTGLRGEYVKNGKRIANRVDATVDFDWSTLPENEKIDAAEIKIQWTGQVLAPETGSYVFSTLNAGGVRLWVDGIRVINDARDRPPRWTDGAPVDLVEGQRYDVKLACFKKIPGPAMMKLKWTGPSFAGRSGVVVGQEWLFPNSPAGAAKPPQRAQLVKTANTQPLIITLTDGWDGEESPVWQITAPPQHGTLLGAAPTLTYTPEAGFVGEDQFTYCITRGKTTLPAETVGITVTEAPPADPARVGPGATVVIDKDAHFSQGSVFPKDGPPDLQGRLSAASTIVFASGTGGPIRTEVGGSNPTELRQDLHLESDLVYSQTYNNIFLTLKGNISGPGSLTKTFDPKDRGTHLVLLGKKSTYSGGTIFRSGYLDVLTPTSMGSGAVTLGGKATAEHVVAFVNLKPMTVQNPINLIGIPDGDTPQPAAMTEFQVVPTLEIASTIDGTGGLLKTGTGRLVLSGVCSFTGPTVVQAGTLEIDQPAALGGGALEIAAGAKLQLDYAGSRRVPALRIAGKDLPAGTYGGNDSTATTKMPDHFTGPGMVAVGDAASIPKSQSTSR